MTVDALAAALYWAEGDLLKLPKRWADEMRRQWVNHANKSWAGADKWLKRRLAELAAGQRAGLNPAMDDEAICKLAEAEARDYRDRLASVEARTRANWGHMAPGRLRVYLLRRKKAVALWLMDARGMSDLWPQGAGLTDAGRLARMASPEFWRRAFRKMHARTVEQCAIALGFVRADGDVYLSRESRNLHQARQRANAFMLQNTVAVSEYGDEKTLMQLAEGSVSNPAIRRGELMTRVAGFEACADALGHVKRWAVLTCPSRMHKWLKIKTGPHRYKTTPNPRYDGTSPIEAQKYLAGQWRKLGAWLARQGLRLYGFRTTEPHHDGCPHWNVLAFFAPMTERIQLKTMTKDPREAVPVFDDGLRRYFLLNDSATEAGAEKHRVKVEAIDPSKGSAAAYIAKYISKGIDGKGMEADLLGHPMEETSAGIVAWARVWRIRQFQQIGGPPVSVWRELRKLHPDNGTAEGAPAEFAAAIEAVNLKQTDPEEKRAVAWMRYTQAQGGPCAKRRDWRVRLLKREADKINRYGEPAAARVVGVAAAGTVRVPAPAHMRHLPGIEQAVFTRPVLIEVESERAHWVVVPKGSAEDAFMQQCDRLAAKLGDLDQIDAHAFAMAVQRREVKQVLREARQPWTRVNNCTALSFTPTLDTMDRRPPDNPFAPKVVQRAKLGRFYNWKTGAGGPTEKATA